MSMLSKKETADALNVSQRTVDRLITTGELNATAVGGQLRIDPEALAAYQGGHKLIDALSVIGVVANATGKNLTAADVKQLASAAGCVPRPSGAITKDESEKLKAYLRSKDGQHHAYKLADDGSVSTKSYTKEL